MRLGRLTGTPDFPAVGVVSLHRMNGDTDIYGRAGQVAVLEERMKTTDERYDKGWILLREDMTKREARLEQAMNSRDRWFYGLLISLLVGVVLLLVRQYLPPGT